VIAITFALPAESSRFVARLAEKKRATCGDTEIIYGKIDSRSIAVFHTGVGEKISRRRMAQLLQDRQFDLLISAGFAGALTDEFDVGDLLLAKNFSTTELGLTPAVASQLNLYRGDLLTVPRVIDSPQERKQLADATGAAAIDMETEFIARSCAEHALRMLSLRAISDTPARPLPAPPDVLFDVEKQKTNLGRLTRHLIAHPPATLRLTRFARQIQKARKILANAIIELLRGQNL
jgi:adenosylhomocysteine nucleosidase